MVRKTLRQAKLPASKLLSLLMGMAASRKHGLISQ
jgi:hypothetical protein